MRRVSPARRGPISLEKWGKEHQRARGSLPLETLSLVCADLGAVPFGLWWGCRFLSVTPHRSAPTGWARIQWSRTLRV